MDASHRKIIKYNVITVTPIPKSQSTKNPVTVKVAIQ